MISLVPMAIAEAQAWLHEATEGYAAELSEVSGMDPDSAGRKAAFVIAGVVPDGARSPEQHFRWIVVDGERVGKVWFGPRAGHQSTIHIWNLEIDPPFRGRGLGGAALDAVAEWAREGSVRVLTLNVFGTNPDARRLYERKGFVAGPPNVTGQIPMRLEL